MKIEVVEGPPRSVKIGVGYGLEDEFRGQFRWEHANLFGGGRRLRFQLKGSSINQTVAGEFRQPHFLRPHQTFVLPLSQAREDEPGYTLARTRLAPRVERMLFPNVDVALGYNIEYDDLSDVPSETKKRLDEYTARGFVSSLTLLVERNTADDLLDPHEGSIVRMSFEQAGGPWGGDFTFVRATLEGKRYVPIAGEHVLAGRLRIGTGDGFGQSEDLPMFRRFFAGGIDSTRGYDRHKLGPLTTSGVPVGGRSVLEGSVELRAPIWKSLGVVLFVDTGLVDEQPLRWDPNDLRFSAGTGVRYATLVGPLRLDVGFPFDPPRGEESWQIHFSVGQAF
jgi:outer membrane protein assembly factor BamA